MPSLKVGTFNLNNLFSRFNFEADAGTAKKLGRVFAFINMLLLWAVAAGMDVGINLSGSS